MQMTKKSMVLSYGRVEKKLKMLEFDSKYVDAKEVVQRGTSLWPEHRKIVLWYQMTISGLWKRRKYERKGYKEANKHSLVVQPQNLTKRNPHSYASVSHNQTTNFYSSQNSFKYKNSQKPKKQIVIIIKTLIIFFL